MTITSEEQLLHLRKRPIMIFSDLHWGQQPKLEEKALRKVKELIDRQNVSSVLIAGDLFNIDKAQQIHRLNDNGSTLIREIKLVKEKLGVDKLYILAGNHDAEILYEPWKDLLLEEAKIHYLGSNYQDEEICIEHGHKFWREYIPPITSFIKQYRKENALGERWLMMGHQHKIFNQPEHRFYSNGSIGPDFSIILIDHSNVRLLATPIEHVINLQELVGDYHKYPKANNLIDDYISTNFRKVSNNTPLSHFSQEDVTNKNTWITVDDKIAKGIVPYNKMQDIQKELSSEQLNSLEVFEISYPISYTFKLGQTVKDAWAVFSATGNTILPVVDSNNEIVGKLSIFTIPKAQKEHLKTQEAEVTKEMTDIGDFLAKKILERRNGTS